MYWYNPTNHTSERVAVPPNDEQAVRMLAVHSDSSMFVSDNEICSASCRERW